METLLILLFAAGVIVLVALLGAKRDGAGRADAPPDDEDGIVIREMGDCDREKALAIYAAAIAAGGATLTAEAPSAEAWEEAHLPCCRLVAERDGRIAGFAALLPFSGRSVYSGVAELSVYVDEAFRGQGVGRALIFALIRESEACGIWTLLAKVLSGNAASLGLLTGCGFRRVGTHEKLGRDRDGVWQDIVLLERRSKGI